MWFPGRVFVFGFHFALATACQRHIADRFLLQETEADEVRRQAFSPPNLNTPEQILSSSFDNVTVDAWSYYYTHGDHTAGRNKTMAQWTADRWSENGVPAALVEYSVYLNYPESASLSLTRPDGSTFEAQLIEDVLPSDETTSDPNSAPAYHGYSASGDVTAEYVYVGRGNIGDFERLLALNIPLKGRIALAKYGGPFRGLKVKNAQTYGMIGCVLFTDPGDDGVVESDTVAAYPDGPARNPSSIQRGSVQFISTFPGDPTTPGIPSKEGAPRSDPHAVIPVIPSLPISYRDAIPLLEALDGHGTVGADVSRSGWLGGLNVTYSTGPAPNATLNLSNHMKDTITPIWNVIGIINGTQADETVIIGNHRDAWIIGGGGDPNSGSAILVELVKAFGKLQETGWKPRRNIVICSWDGEEYGLLGSTEWVEEYAPWLSKTAISYLNVDVAVSGPFPDAAATPELHNVALDIMKKVVYPQDASQTMYDAWQALYKFQPETRGFGNLGSGSDYTAFIHNGIGALDIGAGGGSKSPVYHYHSNYDSYHWMATYGDPGFKYHVAIGQFLTLLAFHLADDAVIPFDLNRYSTYLGYFYRDLIGNVNGKPNSASLQKLLNITDLSSANSLFQKRASAITSLKSSQSFLSNDSLIAQVNGIQRDFQRAFVSQGGLPGRGFYKNVAYAPGIDTGYSPVTFPGITEALNANDFALAAEWVKKTANAVRAAANILQVS